MSVYDDDDSVDPSRDLDDRAAEALLSGHDTVSEPILSAFVADVRGLGEIPPPVPNLALTAMLEHGLTADDLLMASCVAGARSTTWTRLRHAVSWRTASGRAVSWGSVVEAPDNRPTGSASDGSPTRRKSWTLPLQLSLAGTGCLALVLGAAAANELPDAAQTAVANVVEAVTPLDLPRPSDDAPEPVLIPTPTASPESVEDRETGTRVTHDQRSDSGAEHGRNGESNGRDDQAPDPRSSERSDNGRDNAEDADENSDHRAPGEDVESDSDSGSGSGSDSDDRATPEPRQSGGEDRSGSDSSHSADSD